MRPFVEGSETSREAAESVAERTVVRHKALIVQALRDGAKTDEEIQAATGISANAERPRRGELVREGLVRASDMRLRTMSGRWATAWVLAR